MNDRNPIQVKNAVTPISAPMIAPRCTLSRVRFTLHDLLRGMIRGSIEAHRRKRSLLRALFQFTHTHRDPSIKRKAGEMNRASTAALTALMLTSQDKIKHTDPEEAIQFSVLTLAAVVQAVIVDEEGTYGVDAPDDLENELTRMIFDYLGIEERR